MRDASLHKTIISYAEQFHNIINPNASITNTKTPVTKSQRFTDSAGNLLTNKIDLDPWGLETLRTESPENQPHRDTSYERDKNKSDEAMHRRYTASRNRFDQPDPYDGSYNLANPQSFNRYSYVKNDPVNLVDPTRLAESWNVIPGFCSFFKR